jgi:uncharacterized protein with GYD domain
MPKYLLEASYTPEGVKGVAEKGGSSRKDAVEQMISAAGGKMECFYFAFGHNDVYVIGELPSNEAVTALALAVNQSGGASVRTVVLLSPEEVDAAAKLSVDYRPPGS